jgi:capsule polysaccharide modification protein KpsS
MYQALTGKRVLLLQGPVGPFFRRFARDLTEHGAIVTRVTLNAADRMYYLGAPVVAFRGRPEQWPAFLEQLLRDRAIDVVFLFGDGRPYHRRACGVARELGIAVYVFEEGYLRPDHITLEAEGVNGRSTMPRDPARYRDAGANAAEPTKPVGNTFPRFAVYSGLYAIAYTFFAWRYPHYQHHRDVNAFRQALLWSRAGWRKLVYRRRERDLLALCEGRWSGRYFLLPLQVHHDSQWQHSSFSDSESLIRAVVRSFGEQASSEHSLVIKHHPLDRGYRDYTALIRELTDEHGLDGRLLYVHDLHLPTLLKHARGTVVMNSTVGLSSVFHKTPVKVLGQAIYDLPGLSFPGSLEQFWRDPGRVDRHFYQRFHDWLCANNQANGSFYRPLEGVSNSCGVRWFAQLPRCGSESCCSSRGGSTDTADGGAAPHCGWIHRSTENGA